MSSTPSDPWRPDDSADRVMLLVADSIGELMGLWNFKPSMGRVWSALYLSRYPLSADEIAERTRLSAGSVSMTVQELLRWGVVKRAYEPGERRRRFEAETDILAMVTRVFRERELQWIETVVERLEEARRILDEEGRSSVPDDMVRNRFLATRVSNLLSLAKAGHTVVDRFARAGTLDLRAIKGALGRRSRTR
jgi:HTH-type transcriptional regulator, glycine betaine synthesis regulator